MPARLSAFVIWALLAGSLAFWALRIGARAPAGPPHTAVATDAVAGPADFSRLLGSAPTATAQAPAQPQDSRFRLVGVMAPKASAGAAHGVALISIDGNPARAIRVGARLEDDLVLQSVGLRSASIGPAQGESQIKLELPPLPEPATGTLPPPGQGGARSNGAAPNTARNARDTAAASPARLPRRPGPAAARPDTGSAR